MCATNGRPYDRRADRVAHRVAHRADHHRTFYITDNKSDERPYMQLW